MAKDKKRKYFSWIEREPLHFAIKSNRHPFFNGRKFFYKMQYAAFRVEKFSNKNIYRVFKLEM